MSSPTATALTFSVFDLQKIPSSILSYKPRPGVWVAFESGAAEACVYVQTETTGASGSDIASLFHVLMLMFSTA